MKDKIIIFIIGLLVGAIIATGGCLIYNKLTIKNCHNSVMERQNNRRGKQQSMGGDLEGQNPPELPGDENGEPRAKPEGENTLNGQPPMQERANDSLPNQNNNSLTKENN